eukprot:9432690-Pyramimonas_sp.AAC.1
MAASSETQLELVAEVDESGDGEMKPSVKRWRRIIMRIRRLRFHMQLSGNLLAYPYLFPFLFFLTPKTQEALRP